MSAETGISRSWPVGRYTCTLTMLRPKRGGLGHVVIEWEPQMPDRLTDAEIAEYRAGRNKAVSELAGELGGNLAVVDL